MELVKAKKCSGLNCFECSKSISVVDLKQLLNSQEFEEYTTNALSELITNDHNLVTCPNPKCKVVIERLAVVATGKGKNFEAALKFQ